MTPTCHTCHADFPDFYALALHISKSRAGHRKGKRWAAKYLLINKLSPEAKRDKEDYGRLPLPENYHENKQSTYRVLSGELVSVVTFCPRCKISRIKLLPVEFTQNPIAWRRNGNIVKICLNCGASE